jgi:uncharacterized membrane protein
MDTTILNLILTLISIVSYIITIASLFTKMKQDKEEKVKHDAKMEEKLDTISEKVDSMASDMKELKKNDNEKSVLIGQHECRIKALEHWRDHTSMS